MRNTNKKGFTIVELVIVVAVIAILAAVLIPTFSGIIKKAQLSADQKAVAQMNTALAIEGNPTTLEEAVVALEKNGINAEHLIPVSAGYSFVWNNETHKIELLERAKVEEDLTNSIKAIGVTAETANDVVNAINNGNAYIKLEADLEGLDSIVVPADKTVAIDLNGKTITSGTRNSDDHQYALNIYGNVTLTNGTINARGVEVRGGGKLTVGDGVTINAVDNNGGAAVYLYNGAEVVINGGTFKSLNYKEALVGGSVILNNGGNLTINGGKFESVVAGPYVLNHHAGTTVVNGGEFIAVRGVATSISGNLTINGGSFTVLEGGDAYPVHAGGTGVVVVNAGVKLNGGHHTACVSPADEGTTTGNITLKTGVIVDKVATTEEVKLVIAEHYN